MRMVVVFIVLLLLMRFGAELPATHSAIAGMHPSGGANLSTLAVAIALGVLPLIGIAGLFRSFSRWHRNFHHRMRTDGIDIHGRRR